MRINKFIASHTKYSRRNADKLISANRVKVNGKLTTALGTDIDPEKDSVEVDGQIIKPAQTQRIYLALNKPAGYICTRSDESGRKNVMELAPKIDNLKPVGRLDKDTEGLILLTNDGNFILRHTHPKFELIKEYFVITDGILSSRDKEKLEKGIMLEDRLTAPAKISIISTGNGRTTLKMEIHEGRKRQIRKMFALIGLHVAYLQRIRIGKILLGDLKKGQYRHLSLKEINAN